MNKSLFVGRVVDKPPVLRSKSGVTYTRFVLAVNDRFPDKNGKWVEKSFYFPMIAYGDIATEITEKCCRGTKISVVARAEQTLYRKNRKSPTKKEIIFTITEVSIDEASSASEEKWTSKHWI